MKIKNKNLYYYIKAVKCRKQESKKYKEWKLKNNLTSLSEMWVSMVR